MNFVVFLFRIRKSKNNKIQGWVLLDTFQKWKNLTAQRKQEKQRLAEKEKSFQDALEKVQLTVENKKKERLLFEKRLVEAVKKFSVDVVLPKSSKQFKPKKNIFSSKRKYTTKPKNLSKSQEKKIPT